MNFANTICLNRLCLARCYTRRWNVIAQTKIRDVWPPQATKFETERSVATANAFFPENVFRMHKSSFADARRGSQPKFFTLRKMQTLGDAALEGTTPSTAISSSDIPVPYDESDLMDSEHLATAAAEAADAEEAMMMKAHARQYELETKALEQNIEQYKQVMKNVIEVGRGGSLPLSQRLLVSWFSPLAEGIDKEQALVWSRAQGTDRISYGPYIILLPPEKLAVIVMHEVMNMTLIAGGAVPFTSLAARIGQAVHAEISMMKLRYKDRRMWSKLAAGRTANIATVRRQARRVLEEADWPARVHVKVGGALLHILLQKARIEVGVDGRLTYERDDPAAAKIPVSEQTREVQSYFLSDKHPFFPLSKDRDAAQLESRDRKVEEKMRVMMEEGLVPPDVAELASDSAAVVDEGDDITEPITREWDAVNKRERVTVPAFKHVYSKHAAGRVTGMIAAHPRLMELLSDSAVKYAHPTHFPMIVPPRPWIGPHTGGFLKQRVPIVRLTPGAKLQIDLLKHASCPQVYDAVTAMGQTPWKINAFVLDTVQQVWQSGGGLAEIPSRKDVGIPEPPSDEFIASLPNDADKLSAQRRHRIAQRHAMQTNADLHSLRCDMVLKLTVAEQFKQDVLYFPHNMDFRGRVYPVPPHLNHMGADVCRGMLTFAHAKPLGPVGLRWLKIHLSNLMGRDKVSLDDRAAFIDDHLKDVFDSAEKPLTGNGWWLKADAPWQALAACKELAAAYQLKNPAEYECALPVHQDGSCNGLQHYAALGRDESGGRAVNLLPTDEDRPQDVYSQVLRLVLAKMEADRTGISSVIPAAGADAVAAFPSLSAAYEAFKKTNQEDIDARAGINFSVRKMAAEFLKGQVDRKVVKQTVMTSVYGVTFIGARQQILNRLKEKFEGHPMPVDELENTLFLCASYLARTTLDSLGDLFAAADAIKKWLADVARLVALAEQPMAWITPLGLPVVQPYRREKSMMVKTVLQDVVIADSSEQMPVSTSRQRSAFPPNYVHSLDSTHMMLTALDCRKRGLTFTAVHDSYWTHAADIDVMSESLREQFISLYRMPLLENFRASLVQRFPGISFPELPARGTLDLDLVKQSRYFFN